MRRYRRGQSVRANPPTEIAFNTPARLLPFTAVIDLTKLRNDAEYQAGARLKGATDE